MEPSGQEGVVIELIRIPSIGKCWRSHTRCRGNRTLRSGRPHRNRLRRPRQSRVRCHRIQDFDRLSGIRSIPVVADPEAVEKSRSKSMVFFDGGNLPLGGGLQQEIVKWIGLCQGRVVVYIRPEEAVLLRKFLVCSNGEIIFTNNLLTYILVECLIPIPSGASVGRTKHRQILRDLIIDADGCQGGQIVSGSIAGSIGVRAWCSGWLVRRSSASQDPQPCVVRESCVFYCRSKGPTHAFIVSEDECAILADGPTSRSAELILPEGWHLAPIEIAWGIQRTVAQELINGAVQLVCTGARNGVHHSARGLPVLRRIVAGQDTKLLDGFNSQVLTEHTSRTAIGVIVDTNAIQAVIILLGTRAGDTQLRSVTAVHIHRSMGLCRYDSRLEIGKVGPGATVQRQLAHGRGVYRGAHR